MAFVRDDTQHWSISGVPFLTMHWYHVIVVWGEASGLHFYLNGCLAAAESSPVSENSDPNGPHNDLILGSTAWSTSRPAVMSEMFMDELKIWDAEMSPDQVWNLFVSHL